MCWDKEWKSIQLHHCEGAISHHQPSNPNIHYLRGEVFMLLKPLCLCCFVSGFKHSCLSLSPSHKRMNVASSVHGIRIQECCNTCFCLMLMPNSKQSGVILKRSVSPVHCFILPTLQPPSCIHSNTFVEHHTER